MDGRRPVWTRIRDIQDDDFWRPEWALGFLNARAFRAKSGHVPDVLNILNARPVRIFVAPPECKCAQDIQDILNVSWAP